MNLASHAILFIAASLATLPLAAQEAKPATPAPSTPASAPAAVESVTAKSDSVRIAELEARVAALEKMVERLQSVAVGGSAAGGTAPRPATPSRGPDAEVQKIYQQLSDAGKAKVRDFFQSHREDFQNKTPEERAKLAREAIEKIAAEDKAAPGAK